MKRVDHIEYPKKLRKLCMAQLMYIAKDAREAAEAHPEGENMSYYLDEMHYALMEIRRRQDEAGYRHGDALRGKKGEWAR